MMGAEGLKVASEKSHLECQLHGEALGEPLPGFVQGEERHMCAREFILDMRPLKDTAGVEVEDIAKRLMDYGYHSPTMSWPVSGTRS